MFFLKKKETSPRRRELDSGKVSILVCSPDFRSPLAVRCLESIRQHTSGFPYELILLENGKYEGFSHPRDINRGLDVAQGEYFVTIDDDVEVTPGWLEALIQEAKPGVGAVGCVNLNLVDNEHHGTIRAVGGSVRPDGSVIAYNQEILKPIESPYVCSCCMLILNRDMKFPTFYSKYYHEAHFCLENWLAGWKTIVSPHKIYHFGGGTMESLGFSRADIHGISAGDREKFAKYWNRDNRLRELYHELQPRVPFNIV